MVNPGTHAAASTNTDSRLPARLPSVISSAKNPAQAFFGFASSSNAATPTEIGIGSGSEAIGARTSTLRNIAESTTETVLDSRLLVAASVPANHPVPTVR